MTEQSSDMVERVARGLEEAWLARGYGEGDQWNYLAAAALEASHHAELVEALREISLGLGEFNRDPLIHAENTIESMKAIASAALAKIGGEA